MPNKNLEINAVIDKDLQNILIEFKMLEKIRDGEVSCPFCSERINFENIGAIQFVEGKLILYCDDLHCIHETTTNE